MGSKERELQMFIRMQCLFLEAINYGLLHEMGEYP